MSATCCWSAITLVGDRLDAVGLPLQRDLDHRDRKGRSRRELLGDGLDIALGPVVDLAELRQHEIDDLGIALEELLRGEIELIVRDDAGAVGERPRAGGGFGGGLERIPDHPGIDRAALERRAGIGRRQEHRLDLGIFDAGFLQRLHQQIVNVGALVQRDLLAFQIGDRIQLAVLRHQDRLALRRRRLIGDILDRRAGGLREDRRRFAGVAEIDRADIERFEQRRAGRKFRPHHLVAERPSASPPACPCS